jgi:hypothetical protein
MDINPILKKVIKIFLYIILILFLVFLSLFIIRFLSAKELNEVSPGIPCDPALLQKADFLFIVPKYQDKSIAENPEWCNKILSLDKELGMYGVLDSYEEFKIDKPREYYDEGVKIFIKCFNKTPEEFKPPQLIISKNNKNYIKKEMKVDLFWNNEIFHKVYSCQANGKLSNKFNDWF